jgi:hypothetical protein
MAPATGAWIRMPPAGVTRGVRPGKAWMAASAGTAWKRGIAPEGRFCPARAESPAGAGPPDRWVVGVVGVQEGVVEGVVGERPVGSRVRSAGPSAAASRRIGKLGRARASGPRREEELPECVISGIPM